MSVEELTSADRLELIQTIQQRWRMLQAGCRKSLRFYLNHVRLDKAGEPALYRDVAEPWQRALAGRLIPALEAVAGIPEAQRYAGPRSFWFTLPRGHDKSSLIARLASWVLAFSGVPLRAVAAAADKEQAGLIAEFMASEARLNPWLEEWLEFGNWQVRGKHTGSRLKILAAEEKSSFGLREDLMIFDEVTHWPRRGLWDTVISGREKRPGSVLIVITNAGLYRTWQRDVFEEIQGNPDWYVYESPGRLASWMSEEKIQSLRRLIPAGLARRLYDNQWVDPEGESSFVSYAEAKSCVYPGLTYRYQGEPGVEYVASIDYAPVRDRTVLCVGHVVEDEKGQESVVVLDRMDVFQGSKSHRVPIAWVERWIEEIAAQFYRPTVVIDPYQMEGVIQRWEGTLRVVRFEARGGKSNYELASALRSLMVHQRLRLYEGAGAVVGSFKEREGMKDDLVAELSRVKVIPKPYGYRIDHDEGDHDDRVIALGQMVVVLLREMRSGQRLRLPDLSSSRWF
jgi:hypothetical protein